MKEQIIPIINLLRSRAQTQKYIAYFSLGGVVFILLGGLYIFIYESSKIAAQDIEQQRKIGTSDSVITELANLNSEIDKNNRELNIAHTELERIKKVIYSDGNSGLNPQNLEYFDKNLNKIRIEESKIGRFNLKKLDELLNDIKDTFVYFESEDIKNTYISMKKKTQNDNLRNLQDLKFKENEYREKLKRFENEHPDLRQSETLTYLMNSIADTVMQIQDAEEKIKEFDKKWNVSIIQKDAEIELKNIVQVNKDAYEEFTNYKKKVENNLDLYNDKQRKQNAIAEKLNTQKNHLSAEKQLFSTSSNEVVTSKNESKMAFYVSTNIARFGIILITIFFAQMFISIYRYSIKVSNFYNARADALMLSTQTETFNNADLPELIALFSTVLTPDKIDFGKMPSAGTNETIKNFNSVYKAD